MIDFSLDADLVLVVDTAQRFADAQLLPAQRHFEAQRAVSDAVWRQAQQIGFDRVDWPDACGGAGLGAIARAMVLETLAGACPGATLGLLPMGSVAHAVLAFGGEAALHRQLQVLRPGARAALVFDARNTWQVGDTEIHGMVPWYPADRVDLLAILNSQGLWLVTQGIVLEPVPGSGLCAAGASQVHIHRAPVDVAWVDAGAAALALAHARVHVAALLVGQMHAAAEYARKYALERQAFGRPIAHHQALAFLLADMHAVVDAARQLLYEAAWRLQTGRLATEAAAGAFIEAAESALFIGSNAVQILGAAGFTRDYPVEKALRELRVLGLLLGGCDAACDTAFAVDEDTTASMSLLCTDTPKG